MRQSGCFRALASGDVMDTLAWIAGIFLAAATAFGLGYWFGYKCGQYDAEGGVREP
jgi:hypothetical protein